MRLILLLSFGCWLLWNASVIANIPQKASALIQPDSTLPKVFIIGEHEKAFENLTLEHSTMLLSACEDNMDLAFEKWWSMIKEMEAYASLIGYDLKGIKMWVNVFWNQNGSIRHIAYHLKPNSKNVDTSELSAFFSSFMNHYSFPLITDIKYSHYGSAAFPTFPKRVSNEVRPDGKPLVKDSSKNKE